MKAGVIKQSGAAKGFEIPPRHWVAGRIFAGSPFPISSNFVRNL
jgi:hypothetical protein